MKIINLNIDGFKKLTGIEMSFDPDSETFIIGDNEQGKTSILDALEYMIKGNKATNDQVINFNKDKVSGELLLGDYSVKRVKTPKSDRLEVVCLSSGNKVSKPQDFLDNLVNELTFNPFPFLGKTGAQKKKFMMDFLNLDFSDIDSNLQIAEADRLLKGREVRNMGFPNPVEKVEEIIIHDLIAQKKDIQDKDKVRLSKHNEEVEAWETKCNEQKEITNMLSNLKTNRENKKDSIGYKRDYYKDAIDRTTNTILELTERLRKAEEAKTAFVEEEIETLKDIEDEIKTLDTRIIKGEAVVAQLPEIIKPDSPVLSSTEDIDNQISKASEHNQKFMKYLDYLEKDKQYKALQKEYTDCNNKVSSLQKEKLDILEKANTGVDGLKIKEDGLYFNDIYSENWSDSEGIRISCQLSQKMHPELQTMFVDRGESFGKKRLGELVAWAKNNGIQLIITKVAEDVKSLDDNTFYIEEGEIKNFKIKQPQKKTPLSSDPEQKTLLF